jgi:tetratricopeptide (TPR) repeat protein
VTGRSDRQPVLKLACQEGHEHSLAVKSRGILIATMILLFSISSASALWMQIETERVPMDRVLTNLRNRLATNSQSVNALYQLGRVYSMAYATNLTDVPVTKEEGDPMFYHPGSDSGVPRQVFPRSAPQAQAEARRNLTNAIGYYERAARLVMKGTNTSEHQWLVVPIHLGLAWCLDQAGRRDEAIDAYRDALHHAWRSIASRAKPVDEAEARLHWTGSLFQ